jgi:hypothetical protein
MKGFSTILALSVVAPSAAFTASSRNAAATSLNMADIKKTSTFDNVSPFTNAYAAGDVTTEKTSSSNTAYVVSCLFTKRQLALQLSPSRTVSLPPIANMTCVLYLSLVSATWNNASRTWNAPRA